MRVANGQEMNSGGTVRKKLFLTDMAVIRMRTRQQIMAVAIAPDYKSGGKTVARILNQALATKLVCVLRYERHHYMANGIHSQAVSDEFLKYAREEQGHADKIAERIMQLGGTPDFSPEDLLSCSHPEYVEGDFLSELIREDLIGERIAIESYSDIIRYLGDSDPASRRMMEDILAREERHVEDMKTLLVTVAYEEKQRNR